jgi:SAM-dependent methyltransferase
MIERVIDWELVSNASYTAVEQQPGNLEIARERLEGWAIQRGYGFHQDSADRILLRAPDLRINIEFKPVDFYHFQNDNRASGRFDLLIAHAFLDLVDLPRALPAVFELLKPGGLFYFSINYDGLTILEPPLDGGLDELVLELYQRTMDDRRIAGKPSGDSRTGRHLFAHFQRQGAQILDAGASDWVIMPKSGDYLPGEDYFLHFIIHTIQTSLDGNAHIDQEDLSLWVNKRRQQIEQGELLYIAHQLDYLGKV